MIAGHFGFAAVVKAKAPSVPLWALMLACQFLDVAFLPLLASGKETLVPVSGSKPGAYGESIIHADYAHSLVGAALLSVVFGAILALRYGKRSGVILGLVVMSHWFLDVLFHRGDMPVLPGAAGGLPSLGFGLWRFPPISGAIEALLVVIGALLYGRAARQVATSDSSYIRRANLCGGLVLASGLLTLGLNLAGQ